LVHDYGVLVPGEATLVCNKTTLALDNAILVCDEATLVPFGELLYKWSTSYLQKQVHIRGWQLHNN
jgi:hypothetical protein